MPHRPSQPATPQPPSVHPDAGAWLQLDRQLCFALYSASLAMTKAYKPLLAPLGLTYPQYLVMLVLWETDNATVSQLGDKLTLDSGTLTPLLKRLQAQGLISRQRDAADERRVLVQLTPAGRQLREAALAVPQAIACAAQCDLGQISHLASQLTGLRHQLNQFPAQSPQAGAATTRPHAQA